jgi:DNA polymerase-1
MTALIDADSIVYKTACAIEEKTIWNENEVDLDSEIEPEIDYFTDLPLCYSTADGLIENILFASGCDDVLLVFTGKGNFRHDNPLGYKEHRKDFRKPLGFYETLEHLQNKYPSVLCEGYEADDYVVRKKLEDPEEYVLCAIDKDVLYQTPGVHYNYQKDTDVEVTEAAAIRYAYYQTLTGDVSDGYKGCPGIGPVKAETILQKAEKLSNDERIPIEEAYWSKVVEAYEDKGLTEDDAINTMRLANMRQLQQDLTIKLWCPPVR